VQSIRGHADPFTKVGEFPGAHRVWLWRNVLVVYWYGHPSADSSDALAEITEQVLAGMGDSDKLSYVHLITQKLKLPDAATRAALLESTHRFAGRTAVAGVVVSGGGFWASAIRSFVTGIAVLAPRSLDLRIFGATQELMPWFPTEHARRTGVQIDGDALLKILEQAQAGCADVSAHRAIE
jgi:hypothetical protein